MTPAARVAAAITVLDDILAGRTAEKALSDWARGSRFAGSKDRAALRDLVFDALRKRASSAAIGGALTGRGLMIGSIHQDGVDLATMFSGEGHAPSPLTVEENDHLDAALSMPKYDAVDLPEWLWDQWQTDLGEIAEETALTLRERAPLFLRVNTRRGSTKAAIQSLSEDGVDVVEHDTQAGCLRVVSNPRRVKLSTAYTTGLIEIQDAASQMAVSALDIADGATVLDYCAGGGGKALAIADMFDCAVTAHDVAIQRTVDIAPRADRAGVQIDVLNTDELDRQSSYDLVVADAPCSGSGTWRRNPEAKWAFSPAKLSDFSALQSDVILAASQHVRTSGTLYYMTCSVLKEENQHVVDRFLRDHEGWSAEPILQLYPNDQSDGFYLCKLTKSG
ncbi:MAG: RsmB/NOP family class I SAM-dependent RNA methyltransferase [Yoonia sp.]|uniref:RsmB/NOP family class I SAM-dependent RNA methyltransferase n=1 Tax=Yoonia sp. TaxID=2212373 RepID=UPI003265E503